MHTYRNRIIKKPYEDSITQQSTKSCETEHKEEEKSLRRNIYSLPANPDLQMYIDCNLCMNYTSNLLSKHFLCQPLLSKHSQEIIQKIKLCFTFTTEFVSHTLHIFTSSRNSEQNHAYPRSLHHNR